MHEYKKIKENLEKELKSYSGSQTLTREGVCDVKNLGKAIYYMNKIISQGAEDGASMRGGSYGEYHGNFEGSYEDGGSYRRGRDSMGRFVSRDMGPRGNAREYGSYDDNKAHMMDKLEKLSREAQNDPDMRRALEQCMDQIERM